MELKRYRDLRNREKARTLAMPFAVSNKSAKERAFIDRLSDAVYKLAQNYPYTQGEVSFVALTKGVRRAGAKKIDGFGDLFLPYYIKFKDVKGYAISAKSLFLDNQYHGVEPMYCFMNSFMTAIYMAKNNIDCKIINGVAWHDHSFTHSVNLIDDKYIIDYNIGVVMDKDLYFALLPYDILDTLDAKKALVHYKDVIKTDVKESCRVFCFDQLVEQIKNGEYKCEEEEKIYFKIDPDCESYHEKLQSEFERYFDWPGILWEEYKSKGSKKGSEPASE